MNKLTFGILREANLCRLPHFKNSNGGNAHTSIDGSCWSLEKWFQATMGEVGEYANYRKKMDRGDNAEEIKTSIGKELADIQTYFDILVYRIEEEFNINYSILNGEDIISEVEVEDNQEIEAIFCSLIREFGKLYDSILTSDIDNFKNIYIIDNIQEHLGMLAYLNKVDLNQVTIDKWNEVSERIKFNKRIENNNIKNI